MRLLKNAGGLLLFPILLAGLLTFKGNLQAQTTQTGIAEYDEFHATVSFSDIMRYDSTHHVSGLKNPANPMKKEIPESEFKHKDLNIHANPSQTNIPNPSNHRMKNSNLASPIPDTTFLGEADTGTAIPPDTYGAVGPNNIMVTLNTQVRITNKSGAQSANRVTLDNWWAAGLGSGLSTFDPKVVYDPYSQRFIFTALANGQAINSYLLLAVSVTSDPTGSWHFYKKRIDATGTDWLDFPELGFNRNWIVVSGNLFTVTNQTIVSAAVYAFDKAEVLAGSAATITSFTSNLSQDFSICPAFTYDSTLNDLFLCETYDGSSAQIKIFTIAGTPTSPTLSTGVPLFGNTLWSSYPDTANGDTGPQSGTTHKVDMDDDRIASVTYRNNSLWFAHNAYMPAANPTRCSVMWWQVDSLGNIIQNGLIDDAATGDTSYAYPSIGVNQANDMLLGYSLFSGTIHPSAAYQYRAASDTLSTLRKIHTYKQGGATYYQTFATNHNRWGDYSSTMIDPSDNQTLWTLQEYATSTANTWGTWWAKIYQCNLPPAPIITGPALPCGNGSTEYYIQPIPGASSYTWTITGTGWSGTSTTDSIAITAGTGTGKIKVVANGLCGASLADSIILTNTATPVTIAPAAITYTPPLCEGYTVYFHSTTPAGATNLRWTIVSGTGWSGSSTVDSIGLTVGSGPMILEVAGVNGCGAGPQTVTQSITPVTTYTSTFTVTTNSPYQGHADIATYTGNAPVNATYNWFFGNGTATPGGTVRGPQHIVWSTIGIKHVNLTVTDSGCTSPETTQVITVLSSAGINEINAALLDVQVFPNPNDGNFNITFNNINHESLNLELIDILGQIVYNEDFTSTTSTFTKTLAAGSLQAGIYWLNIRGKDSYYTEKIFIK